MTTGPSKEELENYWKTSRQYFDELASYYRTADPEYYQKYIAPFYTSPLYAVSAGKGAKGSAKAIFVSLFGFIAILIAGIAVFFISQEQPSNDNKIDKKETIKKPVEENRSAPQINEDIELPEDDFILATKYIAEKDYNKAEEHLRKIKPGSKNYEQAQQLLESIKYLRKYDK